MLVGKSSLGALIALVTTGCLGEGARPPQGQLQVSVAPLQLEGITDAEYSIVVTNAPDGAGEVVWQQTITSDRYGDGSGSITYIGTCDADAGTHTVTLTLDSLTDANGTVDPTTYVNPTPVSLEPTCVENADVPVLFDITLMRSADQGFFDVSVQFEDIFCSAKLDCQNPDTSDLDLLFNGTDRDMTVVLGFACTGGLGGDTYLYMDDLVIDCTNSVTDVRVEPTGLGVVAPTSNPNAYLFGAAIYRGVEDNGIMYWNAALGLNAAAFGAMGDCTLKTRATASSTPWPQMPGGFPLPEATVYPVIEWDVQLTSATQRVCTQHEVNGGNGVATNYLGYLPLGNGFTWANVILYMQHRLEKALAGTLVLSAGAPICNPSCAHGGCVDPGTGPECDCTGTGYEGPTCAVPVCTSPCQNGGDCVAPDTCDCTGTGYGGPTCESDIDECLTANGGCSLDATCTNTVGGLTCECDPGFYGDGIACTACPAGEVQPLAGQVSCDLCPAGTYDDGDETCATCPTGQVQPNAGETSCSACPIGTFDNGTETCATCATCNPGQQVVQACGVTTDTVCGLCPAGTFGDGVTCTTCPAGEVQPDAGSASCSACPAGTYDDGDETCAACPTGQVQPSAGQTSCSACPSGSYDDGDETCATCTTCLAGQQTVQACGVTTDTVCGLCPAGTFGDGVTCTACPAGQVQPNAGSASCSACPAGTYDDGDETCATCTTCLAGQQTVQACGVTTNTVCGLCPAGTFGDGVTCTACPAGQVQPTPGSASCSTCPAGTYDDGDETCAACPAGQVQPLPGQTSCTACTGLDLWLLTGTYDDGTETCATCTTCAPGERVFEQCTPTSDTFCVPCGPGYYGTDGMGCTECPAGEVQPDAGSTSCDACPAGTYDDGDETCATCTTCAAGTYQTGACTATSDRTCGTCAAVSGCVGTVTCTSPTDSVCSQCPAGYAQASPGAACTDIDECATNTDNCDQNATCTNTVGGFTCACTGGATYGNGVTCSYYSSCLTARQAGVTTSGARYIDPDGAGPVAPQFVTCDMANDGGGYTFQKVSVGSAYNAAQAEAYCEARGMQLFIPRSATHLTAAYQLATHPNVGPSGSAAYLSIMGIYPKWKGATCPSMALHSGNTSCNWEAGDGGQFFVSTLTTISEPNGDNDLDASMGYSFDSNGNATGWNDVVSPGYTSSLFICDVGDKAGQPRSCADWRALGYTTSGAYTIDPDDNGPKSPVSIYCDMQTDGGGWTLVQNSTFATFDNTPFIGTANVCTSIAGCTTGGTTNIFAPSQVTQYLFVCDYDGDIANPHLSVSMYSPANYNRGQGTIMTLYQAFTDSRRGTTAAGEVVGQTNSISYGSAGGRNNVAGAAMSVGWFEGNYHDIANNESFQLTGANWGHHHYTFVIPDASFPSTGAHYSYYCGDKIYNSAWTDTEKANARWLVYVR